MIDSDVRELQNMTKVAQDKALSEFISRRWPKLLSKCRKAASRGDYYILTDLTSVEARWVESQGFAVRPNYYDGGEYISWEPMFHDYGNIVESEATK